MLEKKKEKKSPIINCLEAVGYIYSSHLPGLEIKVAVTIRVLILCLFSFPFQICIYLAALGLSCGTWDLVPPSGIEPVPLHWKVEI